ncbi:hypothetical protein MA16_Dca006988 [Dendrobium catenatum]|uniref:Uncharacterized protein n=1 Tax=Dendrobium catenatum TaxID=906689 RepID=A0A2I0VX13_9ASPA|nr:hypothetical protein MA16_Dca006988 [Dendrobium catenatum]
MKKFKRIIEDFSSRTRQKVNKHKSVILLGKSVKKKRRKAISKLWGYKIVNEFNYVGIKLTLRRLVASDFNFILRESC